MKRSHQLGVTLLAIVLTVAATVMIAGADGMFAQDGSKTTDQEQASRIVAQNFTARNHTIHSAENVANINFERSRINITGRILASQCEHVVLESITYNNDTGILNVTVFSKVVRQSRSCDATGGNGYQFIINFEGGVPERVNVAHNTTAGTKTVAIATD